MTRTSFDVVCGDYGKGAAISYPGFTSTSMNRDVGLRFANHHSGKRGVQLPGRPGRKASGGVLFRIWTCSGVSINNFSWLSCVCAESEVIMGADVSFLVTRPPYTDPGYQR